MSAGRESKASQDVPRHSRRIPALENLRGVLLRIDEEIDNIEYEFDNIDESTERDLHEIFDEHSEELATQDFDKFKQTHWERLLETKKQSLNRTKRDLESLRKKIEMSISE